MQLNKLKSGIKNGAEVTLSFHQILLVILMMRIIFRTSYYYLIPKFRGFVKLSQNGSSGNIKLSKTQLHKIGQLRVFLWRLLGPLLKTGLPLIKNVLKPLAKSVLIPLGLTAAASATDATIYKEMFGSGTKTLITSNE